MNNKSNQNNVRAPYVYENQSLCAKDLEYMIERFTVRQD